MKSFKLGGLFVPLMPMCFFLQLLHCRPLDTWTTKRLDNELIHLPTCVGQHERLDEDRLLIHHPKLSFLSSRMLIMYLTPSSFTVLHVDWDILSP